MTTKPQFLALWAAFKRNGAYYAAGSKMGGAKRRMLERMAKDGLLTNRPPFPITTKGLEALREACRIRWAKVGAMAYQDELQEVEAALAAGVGDKPPLLR